MIKHNKTWNSNEIKHQFNIKIKKTNKRAVKMEEEEGTEAVFREGMNAVLKEQATSKNNVSNEGNILLYTKEEKKLYEKNPPSNFPPSS